MQMTAPIAEIRPWLPPGRERPTPDGADGYPAPGAASRGSSFLFTAVFLYLFIPSAVVLLYFGPWPAASAIAAVMAVYWGVATPPRKYRLSARAIADTWPYLILASGAVWFSGILPPFAETLDWYKHYAVFNALVDQSWPPIFPTEKGIATLRYSLAYYVVPSVAAKLLGSRILSAAIFAWTVAGLYLAMLLAFGGKARTSAEAFLLGGIFLLFSGADIVGYYLTGFMAGPLHFEWWAGFGELSSSVTDLFWVPQHALAAWLAAFLVLRYPVACLRRAGVIVATVALWSPFSALGVVPVLAWAAFRKGWKPLATRMNWIAAPVLLIAAAVFLTKGSAGIPAGVIWDSPQFTIGKWLFFLAAEFGVIALSLWILGQADAVLIGILTAFLSAIALFNVGVYNDLLMRASIPALGILAVLSATAVAHAPGGIRKAPLIICLVAGLATPMGEMMRSIVGSRIKNHDALTILDVVRDNDQFVPQYLVFDVAGKFKFDNVMDIADLWFTESGPGQVDRLSHHVESGVFTDTALVSNDFYLAPGWYRLDAVMNWDVVAREPDKDAAYLSLQERSILTPIKSSKATAMHATSYYYAKGGNVRLSFGLGGQSPGKGFIELTELKISSMKRPGD